MLSTEGRFTFKKERPIYSTQLSESVGISKVSFLSVDSERNKCLFPEGVGGGGYFWEFLVWVYRPVLQILNLFQIKKM